MRLLCRFMFAIFCQHHWIFGKMKTEAHSPISKLNEHLAFFHLRSYNQMKEEDRVRIKNNVMEQAMHRNNKFN